MRRHKRRVERDRFLELGERGYFVPEPAIPDPKIKFRLCSFNHGMFKLASYKERGMAASFKIHIASQSFSSTKSLECSAEKEPFKKQ